MEVTVPFRPLQKELYKESKRFNVIVCHRRFGKTVYELLKLIIRAYECKLNAPRYAYIAPTYKQAKNIAWDYLKRLLEDFPGVIFNESELRADLPNGARIQLFGADNPDSLRGIYLDGVVLDEVAQMSPRVWSEIIRPLLADRKGWCDFIGTPQGHNFFYEVYERASTLEDWNRFMFRSSTTGILDEEELRQAQLEMSDEEFEQEFECSWHAAIRGAYYGKLVAQLEKDNKVTKVPYDPMLEVETWWDLGMSDSTCIWFVQRNGLAIQVFDYYEASGYGLDHYVKVLREKDYNYGKHIAPHDIEVRELGTGASRKEVASKMGLKFQVAPKVPVLHGIDVVRATLPKCYFDESATKEGLEALRQYRCEFDDKKRDFRPTPLHDWASHAADAFRYGCVYKVPKKPKSRSIKQDLSWVV